MDVMYNANCTASISMKTYHQEAIQEFGEDCLKQATMSAKKDLFDININLPGLGATQWVLFDSIVEMLLYVCKRGRPDIQLAMIFLCTRVLIAQKKTGRNLKEFSNMLPA